jgi:hypothetical protein
MQNSGTRRWIVVVTIGSVGFAIVNRLGCDMGAFI